ncbi:MAG: low-specificity L-threonine aldolase [Anaerolineales bacterium]|nr:low-specificity L-threonine aldolase [Anaerolineales bacterium]
MLNIDLRSDTVTLPTPAMREAMARAPLGDDVYGEDPTVNRLQDLAAQMLGKSAGLFVPSGTMGNLASVLAHCGRGDEILLGHLAHTFLYEAGGIAALGGVHPRTVQNQPDGTLSLDDLRAAIRADDAHFPPTRLIALENTHNRCAGTALPVAYGHAVRALADEYGLKMHLDGARLFNAAEALGVSAQELAAPFDSVTFCLSKALCAPVGSVIVGDQAFIHRAHRARKQLGGGMRQAGVLAAAGIVALETMVERLKEDHARAQLLAGQLAELPGIILDSGLPQSNMVYVTLDETVRLDGKAMQEKLVGLGVKVGVVASRRFRLVTHYWVDDAAIVATVTAFRQALAGEML